LDTLRSQLEDHLQSHYRAELDSAQCLTGPHKDDFDVTLGGISLKSYGSQGQTRTAAISLKLAQRALCKRETGEEPVLLLDDVLSELDPGRQDFVLNQITEGQVFITCCEPGRFTKLGKTIEIFKGHIKE
jgi:DNA replication and repair protein RecF